MSAKSIMKNSKGKAGDKPTKAAAFGKKAEKISEEESITIRLSKLGIIKTSPSNKDLVINNSRILSVLNELLEKLKVVLCFKYLFVNNFCLLRKYLTHREIDFVKRIAAPYCDFKANDVLEEGTQHMISLLRKSSSNLETVRGRSCLLQMFEIVWVNRPLRAKMLELFVDKLREPFCVGLVRHLETFIGIVARRVNQTSEQFMEHEKYLKNLWRTSKMNEKEILYTREVLNTQRKKFNEEVEAMDQGIKQTQAEIDSQNHILAETVFAVQKKSVETMQVMSQDSVDLREELQEESDNMLQQYENLLAADMRHEKNMRAKKNKTETQVQSWLIKYDSDMTTRQEEFDELTYLYTHELNDYNELKTIFDEQELEYVPVMAEKAAYDFMIWSAKNKIFLDNHCARILQWAYRAYRKYKKSKKKKQ